MSEDGAGLVEQVDRLTKVIELALAPQLEAARRDLRSDPVDDAILTAASSDWKPAKKLRTEVEAKTGKKERTVQGRIGDLTARGFLEFKGAAKTLAYRTNSVVAG